MPDRLATFFAVAIPVASRAARPMYPREAQRWVATWRNFRNLSPALRRITARKQAPRYTRIGISTYSAGAFSLSRISVGAAASARWTSTLSPSIWPRMSIR